MHWTKDHQARLDGLRDRELAGTLTEPERVELAALMAHIDIAPFVDRSNGVLTCREQFGKAGELLVAELGQLASERTERCGNPDVKDFHTAGKVSATLGIPLHQLPQRQSYTMPYNTVVNVPQDNYRQAVEDIQQFVSKIM